MVQFQGYQEEQAKGAFDASLVRRLWAFVRPYRAAFAANLGILLVAFAIELLKPWLVQQTLDGPVAHAVHGQPVDTTVIWKLGAAYLAATLASAALGYGYALLTTWNGQRVIRDVRTHLFAHTLALGARFFDRNAAGKLVTRVTSDVENLNELISTGVLLTLFDLLKIFGFTIALFLVDVRLALYSLLTIPVILGVSLLFRRYARESYREVRGRLGRQNAFTAEAIGGVRATRVFNQEAAVTRHYRELNAGTRASWLRTVFHFAVFFSTVDLAVRGAKVGMLLVGGQSILAGTMSAGVFVQFWLYFTMLTDPIKELGEKYNVLQSAFASGERIFHILDETPLVQSRPGAPPSRPGPAHVAFESVSFAYRPGQPVLREVTFTVEPGQWVAIVGPTGAGKTTILSLISRLADPQHGRVLLDGHDLRDLDLDSVRRRIAVVPQDVFLFTGSILDNVRLFDDSIAEERVHAALEAVGALEFVSRLPGGLQGEVEERGANFSQGERQLLSFARALAHDPDVLVLDEATASIDTESEARIQAALRVLLRGRTALIVAHRLSTVRDADLILVLREGRIVEAGAHAELAAAGGAYATMLQKGRAQRV